MTSNPDHPVLSRIIPGLVRGAGRLPLPLLHALAAGMAHLIWPLRETNRQVIEANLAICYADLTPRQRRRLGRRSMVETARTALEAGRLWFGPAAVTERLWRETVGIEHLEAAQAQGRGVILAIPHLGCWEFLGLILSRRQAMTSLYRPPRMAALEQLVRDGRERFGARLVPVGPRGIRAVLTRLRAGELVAILPDQAPAKENGVIAPFCGQPAWTMTLLSRLAASSGAPVVFTWAERLPRGRGFRVHFEPAPEGIADPDPEVATRALNAGVEGCVRQRPEQYQWCYRR
ncbi:MAG: lysophospholipid acyltransferase family protein, partial [Pseudomonadota bacterium]